MNIVRTIAKGIPLLMIALIVVQLVWSNTLVGSGREITAIDMEITELRQQNQRLTAKIASASSIRTISDKAIELGLKEPSKQQFVMFGNETLPVAIANP